MPGCYLPSPAGVSVTEVDVRPPGKVAAAACGLRASEGGAVGLFPAQTLVASNKRGFCGSLFYFSFFAGVL